MTTPWAIPIETVTAAVGGTMLWTHVGRTTLTVAIKATFALTEGVMGLTAPEKLVIWERVTDDGALIEDVDFVPHKPRAEVHVVGHANSPTPTTHLVVRLCVRSQAQVLVDKSVRVVGDRIGAGEPKPFRKMPLTWQRACFDPLRNPVGINKGSGMAPNLYDPEDAAAAIAFAPVPRAWPMRSRFIGQSGAAKGTDLCGPRVDMPNDLSWGFFLGATEDQQATSLRGGEHLYLQNLVEGKPQFTSQLPQARGVGRFYEGAGDGSALEFKLDTLSIDTDRMRVSAVWRATMPFPANVKPEQCLVVAGVELGGQALDLSRASANLSDSAVPSAPAATRVFSVDSIGDLLPPQTERVNPAAMAVQPAKPVAFRTPERESSTNVFANQAGPAAKPHSFDFEPETAASAGGGSGTLALTPEAAQDLLAKSAAAQPVGAPAPAPTHGRVPAGSPGAAAFGPPSSLAPLVPPPGFNAPSGGNAWPAYAPGNTHQVPIPNFQSAANAPVLVVRAAQYEQDDDDVIGSTMAMSPESAAILLARPQKTAPPATEGRAPSKTTPPNPPMPAPPPPFPPELPRHGTLEMDRVPDSELGGGTMVLEVNVPDPKRR